MAEKKVKKTEKTAEVVAEEISSNEVLAPDDKKNFKGKYHYGVGRRKRAIAQVYLYKDETARVIINGKGLKEYFPIPEFQAVVVAPLKALGKAKDYSVLARVTGGGKRGQVEAVRHGISRALLAMDPEAKKTLRSLGLLTRDSRRKERKKPGLKRARRAPQWSKR